MNEISVDQELRDIENFLRNNIMYILKNKYGDDWENHLGVTDDRIAKWIERRDDEKRRMKGRVIETRLLYFSDFYDLKTIIDSNWNIFSLCFESKRIIDYQLSQLESFRNPNAHNRDLLDYQKHLLIGFIGDIKSGITRFRGNIENKSTFFPEYDSIVINGKHFKSQWAHINGVFREGDIIDISIYVTAPSTQKIYYALKGFNQEMKENMWTENNKFQIVVDESMHGGIDIGVYYKSDSKYHLHDKFDGHIPISFIVVSDD